MLGFARSGGKCLTSESSALPSVARLANGKAVCSRLIRGVSATSMKRSAVIAVGVGLVMFAAIFCSAALLLNAAPALYPRGTGWGALIIASVPFFAAGFTTGRWSGERSVLIRSLLGATLGALAITLFLTWPYVEGADFPGGMVAGMYLASVVICALAAALARPRSANKTMEPTR